jgi:hypothetical protein
VEVHDVDGLYGFNAASLSVGAAVGYALRKLFLGRIRRNVILAILMFLTAVALPFLISAGWPPHRS